jgi:hypothetical protein
LQIIDVNSSKGLALNKRLEVSNIPEISITGVSGALPFTPQLN